MLGVCLLAASTFLLCFTILKFVFAFLFLAPRPTDEGNPLLDALTEKLCSEFEEKPNSRCIIFVKTRAIARALLTYLTEQRKLKKYQLNPKQMTGAAAHRENFGESFAVYFLA